VGREEINVAYIALGSNIGDRKAHLDKAISVLNATIGKVTKQARYIETEPVEMQTKDLFLNTCIEFETALSAKELLMALKKIEEQLGRSSCSKGQYESRTIDLDIIFFNQVAFQSTELTIPHPRYHVRDFVIYPLMEINDRIIDPKSMLSLKQLIN
jgi:2-amino-4-hydroxy-6-hydroxymethyldihydropteridine diphosphokinase